jgi:hypothetical protein
VAQPCALVLISLHTNGVHKPDQLDASITSNVFEKVGQVTVAGPRSVAILGDGKLFQ